jgi:hypothetical protein
VNGITLKETLAFPTFARTAAGPARRPTGRHTRRKNSRADAFQQKFNSEIYDTHGDGGSDFTFHGMTVEVIHLGMDGAGPRLTGNLIVNPHEPQRWANIYVVVRGSIETAFDLVGWYVHDDLIELPKRNFRFGDRFCCHVDDLRKMNELFEFDYS